MKKIILLAIISILSLNSFSQQPACEQREEKLLQTIGSFSSALFYNTYGALGSIADGYTNDLYNNNMVNGLLDAQKKLMDNLMKVLIDLDTGHYVIDTKNRDYIASSIDILKGLKQQAQLVLDYVKSKTPQRLEAYEAQRQKNWKDISKLMGIKE